MIRSQIKKRLYGFEETFGYITKAKRQEYGIEKSHVNDAFVIAGGSHQKRTSITNMLFKRKNNRSIQKNRKGFKPSIRKKRYPVQPKDILRFEGILFSAIGSQNKGAYIKMTDGGKPVVKSIKKIDVIYHQKTLMVA